MLLSDSEIRKLCLNEVYHHGKPLISPFSEPVSGNGIVSYGLTSAGYDVRLAPKAKLFKNIFNLIVRPGSFFDPAFCDRVFEEVTDEKEIILPPHSYGLFMAYEWTNIPRNIKGRCLGKSTYARCGVVLNTTPMEPEWSGHLTIEIANTSPCPVALQVMQGIAQFEFELVTGTVETSYTDKSGKYQNQLDVTPAIVR